MLFPIPAVLTFTFFKFNDATLMLSAQMIILMLQRKILKFGVTTALG